MISVLKIEHLAAVVNVFQEIRFHWVPYVNPEVSPCHGIDLFIYLNFFTNVKMLHMVRMPG